MKLIAFDPDNMPSPSHQRVLFNNLHVWWTLCRLKEITGDGENYYSGCKSGIKFRKNFHYLSIFHIEFSEVTERSGKLYS